MKLHSMKQTIAIALLGTLSFSGCATSSLSAAGKSVRTPAAAEIKPKYGSEATLLSGSHEYIVKNPAPDYWAISPYYIAQQDDRSCSVAAITMIVNAAREGRKFTADDELATQQGVLKRVNDDIWTKGVGPGGHGITLDQMKPLVEKSLQKYGIETSSVTVQHIQDTSDETKASLRKVLAENEKSANDFLIINFIQGVFTGDAQVGHFAPIAAYDKSRRRVLIMDPDRQWYEPYWVSEDTLLKGMATQDGDNSGRFRGYLWVKIKK
jgi:hypothetical protein